MHADSAAISSTDMKIWGGKPRIGTTGSGGSVLRHAGIFFLVTAICCCGFAPIPKESATALGVTRGKAFTSGVVFINGKYIEPPYVVERWGTGIRINRQPVTGPLIAWEEFLKTQPEANLEVEAVESAKTAETANGEKEAPKAEVKQEAVDASAAALADLFDDDPVPVKTESKPVASSTVSEGKSNKVAVRKPTAKLKGKFEKNESSKALLKRINAQRTEIDAQLRCGGFICFGNSYSWVIGDARVCAELLAVLPELQQRSTDLNSFLAGIRQAKLVYLNENLGIDLFRNRIDYRALKERRVKILKEREFQNVLDQVADPIL